MSNAARNSQAASVAPSSPGPSTSITERAIREHPADEWTVVNGHGLQGDCDYRETTLVTTIDGHEVRLSRTDFDTSYGSGFRPDRIGSIGQHHWNSESKLFAEVARDIQASLSLRAFSAVEQVRNLIGESDPLMWERGPQATYRGGEFLFGGYRRSFDNDSAPTSRPEHDRCKEGYLGRIGHTSVLVREMRDGSVHGEIAVSQGDLHNTVRLSDTEARKALETLRTLKID